MGAHSLIKFDNYFAFIHCRAGVPDRINRAETQKLAQQKILVGLLQQRPFRADAEKCLNQPGQQQMHRRPRGLTFCGVQLTERRIETVESLSDSFGSAQRMAPDPLLYRQ